MRNDPFAPLAEDRLLVEDFEFTLSGNIDWIANRIGIPAAEWHNKCHQVSLAIIEEGIVDGRVVRGYRKDVGSQHSWIVPEGFSALDYELIIDPTCSGHDKLYDGPPRIDVVENSPYYCHAADVQGTSPYTVENPPPLGAGNSDGSPADIDFTEGELDTIEAILVNRHPDIWQCYWLVASLPAHHLDVDAPGIYRKIQAVFPAAIPIDRANLILGDHGDLYASSVPSL